MGTTILIYSGSNPLRNRCVRIKGSVHSTVAMVMRNFKKKPTVEEVAAALGGEAADPRLARVTIKVSGWTCYVTDFEGTHPYKASWDPKPGINHIRDYRTRPAPFMRDGSCRG